ncbi:hypothetical protein DERF_009364 [Dermatophagoides farinae]|uniref:Uncharacterized protein n=1 Tax=Dermatophagoides farinae TaxID=6954 RepID=A0A922L5L7_DERFA|nr:hypothetical protein DERF_009364 [Dermatophagoides farinae]
MFCKTQSIDYQIYVSNMSIWQRHFVNRLLTSSLSCTRQKLRKKHQTEQEMKNIGKPPGYLDECNGKIKV